MEIDQRLVKMKSSATIFFFSGTVRRFFFWVVLIRSWPTDIVQIYRRIESSQYSAVPSLSLDSRKKHFWVKDREMPRRMPV